MSRYKKNIQREAYELKYVDGLASNKAAPKYAKVKRPFSFPNTLCPKGNYSYMLFPKRKLKLSDADVKKILCF